MAKKTEFALRLDACRDELKWLYCELYHNDEAAFEYFCDMLRRSWADRKASLGTGVELLAALKAAGIEATSVQVSGKPK